MMIWGYHLDFGNLHIYIYTHLWPTWLFFWIFHFIHVGISYIYIVLYIYYPIIAMTHTTGIVWLPSGLLKRGERWTVPVAKKADLTAPRFITGAYYPIMIPMIIPYQLQWLWSIFFGGYKDITEVMYNFCIYDWSNVYSIPSFIPIYIYIYMRLYMYDWSIVWVFPTLQTGHIHVIEISAQVSLMNAMPYSMSGHPASEWSVEGPVFGVSFCLISFVD